MKKAQVDKGSGRSAHARFFGSHNAFATTFLLLVALFLSSVAAVNIPTPSSSSSPPHPLAYRPSKHCVCSPPPPCFARDIRDCPSPPPCPCWHATKPSSSPTATTTAAATATATAAATATPSLPLPTPVAHPLRNVTHDDLLLVVHRLNERMDRHRELLKSLIESLPRDDQDAAPLLSKLGYTPSSASSKQDIRGVRRLEEERRKQAVVLMCQQQRQKQQNATSSVVLAPVCNEPWASAANATRKNVDRAALALARAREEALESREMIEEIKHRVIPDHPADSAALTIRAIRDSVLQQQPPPSSSSSSAPLASNGIDQRVLRNEWALRQDEVLRGVDHEEEEEGGDGDEIPLPPSVASSTNGEEDDEHHVEEQLFSNDDQPEQQQQQQQQQHEPPPFEEQLVHEPRPEEENDNSNNNYNNDEHIVESALEETSPRQQDDLDSRVSAEMAAIHDLEQEEQ